MGKVKLTRIAMVTPNSKGVYASSRQTGSKIISQEEFNAKYADSARSIEVSSARDGVSNPCRTTAYGSGLDCWYIAESIPSPHGSIDYGTESTGTDNAW